MHLSRFLKRPLLVNFLRAIVFFFRLPHRGEDKGYHSPKERQKSISEVYKNHRLLFLKNYKKVYLQLQRYGDILRREKANYNQPKA
jgi:cell division protein FtsB